MNELPSLLLTTPKDGYKIPNSSDINIVRCYNVPLHFIPTLLETYISDFFLKCCPEICISFKEIIPPCRIENDCMIDHCWKMICSNAETFECLLEQKCMVISVGTIDGINGKEEKNYRIYFYEGDRLDFPYPVPIPPISSPSNDNTSLSALLNRSNNLVQNVSLSGLDENSFYWLNNAPFSISKGNYILNQNDTSIVTQKQQQFRINENLFSQQQLSLLSEWPSDIQWRDVPDYVKKKFCIVIRNKPPRWEESTLEQFLNIQYGCNKEDTPVKSIYMTKTFPKLATVACKNEIVRNRFMALKSFKLPAKWAHLNTNRGMSDKIQIEPYMPPNSFLHKNIFTSDECITENYVSRPGGNHANFYCPSAGTDSTCTYNSYYYSTKTLSELVECNIYSNNNNNNNNSSTTLLKKNEISIKTKSSFSVLEARNKPYEWDEIILTNFIESHYKKIIKKKFYDSTENNYLNEKAILYCWPCANFPIGTFVCHSEEIKKILLSDRYVKLPFPYNQTNINKGLSDYLQLFSFPNHN